MKKLIPLLFLLLLSAPAHAGCYADYKAKKDNPLRLHYGVIEIPSAACSGRASKAQVVNYVASRFSGLQWQLLNVISVFDDSGLARRKASAGQYFLRY